jgi:methionyl-tRNA formyltransferase
MVKDALPSLRVVFFGTPEFAVPTLRALQDSRHPVVGVVTQPDRARGRGHKTAPSPVKQLALDYGVPVLQPERMRAPDFLSSLEAFRADLGVVAAYGRILTDTILGIPRLGLINVHASLLPKYRGAAPIHRAVLAGESRTGVTIMRVIKALDAGPMISSVVAAVEPNATSSDVEAELARIGATALVEAVDAMAEGRSSETPQDDALATYAPKIEKADGIIDWSRPARDIHNQIRGLHPWPHAYSDLEGERTILLASSVDGEPDRAGVAAPGTIVRVDADALIVQTGSGLLRVLTLRREGRRAVNGREFATGRGIESGSMFQRSPE